MGDRTVSDCGKLSCEGYVCSTTNQFAKSCDLCAAFCTYQGASVRQRRACSPLQKLEKVAEDTFSTRSPAGFPGGPDCQKTYLARGNYLPYFSSIRKKPRPVRGFLHFSRGKCAPKACIQPLAKTRKSGLSHFFDTLKQRRISRRCFFACYRLQRDVFQIHFALVPI